MLGIGHRQEKNVKIKILSEKAKEFNQRASQLESEGVSLEEIHKRITQEEFAKRHQDSNFNGEPHNNSSKMNGLGGSLTMGFQDAHKTKTETKTMFIPAQTSLQNYKQLKKQGAPLVDKEKQKQQFQTHKKMRNRIDQDHLDQLWTGVKFEEKKNTDYTQNFVHNQHFQEQITEKDFKYHPKKNEIKWFSDQYIKIKNSLRKTTK